MKSKTKIVSLILFLSFFIMLISFSGQKADWKGTIKEENGVIVVKNPKEPMYSEDVFKLTEELAIGGTDERDEYMFSSIRNVAVNEDERIYILDYKEAHIKVFDKDFIQ